MNSKDFEGNCAPIYKKLIAFSGLIFFIFISSFSCSREDNYSETKIKQGDIIGDVNVLTEKKPFFHKTEVNGTKIEFFVIKINGEVMAYLDRCRKCFNSGLGFSFDKEYVRCKACNVRFPIEKIVDGVGSCYPIPVAISIKNNGYSITVESLYFSYRNRKPKL